MIKVVFITRQIIVGGVESVISQLISDFDKKKFQVSLIVLKKRNGNHFEKVLEKECHEVIYLGKKDGFQPSAFFSVCRCLQRISPDLIHLHLTLLYELPWAMRHRIPLLYTVHNESSHENKKFIGNILFRFGIVKPVCISPTLKTDFLKRYHMKGADMILNPVDLRRFAVPERRFDRPVTFICAGRLDEVKNHKLLLSAFREILKSYPENKLIIAGDGILRGELEQYIAKYGMEQNVSMAGKLPVIASEVGGIPDIVKENGIRFPSGNKKRLVEAMERMITDNKMRERMSEEGLRMVTQFDSAESARNYQNLYMKYIRDRVEK